MVRYKYNGLNQKIKRTDSIMALPDLYYYYNDAWQIVEEKKVSDGTVRNWYAWGTQYIDDLIVRSVSGGTTNKYYVQDARFNVTTILNSNGTVSSRYVYDGYGYPTQRSADWVTASSVTDDLHLFSGRKYEIDTALYDFRNRAMNPETGAFLTVDPIGVWGDKGNYGNGYAFVRNDAVNNADPFGLSQIASRTRHRRSYPVPGSRTIQTQHQCQRHDCKLWWCVS